MRLPSAKNMRLYAALAIFPAAAVAALVLRGGSAQTVLAHGPMLAAHQGIECSACHVSAPGNTRQQIQAGVRYVAGLRVDPVDFGYQKVNSDQCLTCHDRPNDRHPIYRFQEPRFRDAVQQVAATSCLGCHSEHGDKMVSSGAEFCSACHQDLMLKADPIEISHVTLIKQKRWGTCMQCHDFHGNHQYSVPTQMGHGLEVTQIQGYLAGGADPFGGFKSYPGIMP